MTIAATLERPSLSGSPSSHKRDALLRAALELFAERTYGATPVPEIAARAQVGTGTVYRHFESKEALANVLYRRCKKTMHEALLDALATGGSSRERFLAIWRGLAAMAIGDPTALRFLELQHHEEYLDEESRCLSDAVFATAEGFIRDAQASGQVRAGNARILIGLVFGAFVGLFKEACQDRYALDAETIAYAADSAWRMIAA